LAHRPDIQVRSSPKAQGITRAGRKEIALRLATGLVFGGIALAFFLGGKTLPGCDDTETKSLLGKIINDLPAAKAVGAQFVAVKSVSEHGFNREKELRSCEGTLVTTRGEDSLQYSVKWQDKSRGLFFVEAQILTTGNPAAAVAADAAQQLEIARRNGTPVDVCVQAMSVSAAHLQANDEANYAK
jgi:hypothetical protein